MTSPDPNAQSGTGAGQSDGTAGQGTGSGTGTGDNSGQSTDSGNQGQQQQSTQDTVTRVEHDQLRNQLRAADQRRQAVENELKQLRDKDLPEAEKMQRDLAELTEERDKLREQLKTERLDKAFLSSNTIKWKNPNAALKLADLSNVTIDDDGKVSGLDAALKALATAEPWMVDSGEGSGDNNDGSRGSTGASGAGGRQQETKPDLKKMATRFPALRTRGLGGQ